MTVSLEHRQTMLSHLEGQAMSEHTRGPWKCTGGGGISACMESETLNSGRRIARRVACAKGTSISEVEANARVIAVAPDLLRIVSNILSSQKDGTWESDCEWFAEEARAAIAKVEGCKAEVA